MTGGERKRMEGFREMEGQKEMQEMEGQRGRQGSKETAQGRQGAQREGRTIRVPPGVYICSLSCWYRIDTRFRHTLCYIMSSPHPHQITLPAFKFFLH